MQYTDETAITEITIGPDGRVYVFGTSGDLLLALEDLCRRDDPLVGRINHLKTQAAAARVAEVTASASRESAASLDPIHAVTSTQ